AKALSIVRLQAGGGDVKLFSALKRQGVEEVAQHLWDWAHPPEKPVKPAKAVPDAEEADPPAPAES
ncbi:MAG: YihA family ribosome biogenesis GTP-binding protein, partial [Polaromonas sp.]|nr:YihA family ribosome biogenesis GTP-binding protein [Polaromonas sp.]